jgi:hypothetical protein
MEEDARAGGSERLEDAMNALLKQFALLKQAMTGVE